tara:strand:- start:9261 stop:10481 length:1221 start_codon:yes stop_codon:yes gene_type:complete
MAPIPLAAKRTAHVAALNPLLCRECGASTCGYADTQDGAHTCSACGVQHHQVFVSSVRDKQCAADEDATVRADAPSKQVFGSNLARVRKRVEQHYQSDSTKSHVRGTGHADMMTRSDAVRSELSEKYGADTAQGRKWLRMNENITKHIEQRLMTYGTLVPPDFLQGCALLGLEFWNIVQDHQKHDTGCRVAQMASVPPRDLALALIDAHIDGVGANNTASDSAPSTVRQHSGALAQIKASVIKEMQRPSGQSQSSGVEIVRSTIREMLEQPMDMWDECVQAHKKQLFVGASLESGGPGSGGGSAAICHEHLPQLVDDVCAHLSRSEFLKQRRPLQVVCFKVARKCLKKRLAEIKAIAETPAQVACRLIRKMCEHAGATIDLTGLGDVQLSPCTESALEAAVKDEVC